MTDGPSRSLSFPICRYSIFLPAPCTMLSCVAPHYSHKLMGMRNFCPSTYLTCTLISYQISLPSWESKMIKWVPHPEVDNVETLFNWNCHPLMYINPIQTQVDDFQRRYQELVNDYAVKRRALVNPNEAFKDVLRKIYNREKSHKWRTQNFDTNHATSPNKLLHY